MTWLPDQDPDAERAVFVAIYGEELWNQIQAVKSKPSGQEWRPAKRQPPPQDDRPATQTEDSSNPKWWEK